MAGRAGKSGLLGSWWRHDAVIATLTVASVALVYWFDLTRPEGQMRRLILIVDGVLVAWFLADWVLDLMEAKNRRRQVARSWWHLLGMVPLVFAGLGFLRLIRLVRLFTLVDHIPWVQRRVDRLLSSFRGSDLRPLAVASVAITLGGAVLVWLAERGVNTDLHELSEAIWWAVVTVTTVGYGDITPITRIGRAVAVVLMVTGIGTIGVLASQVSAAIIRNEEEEIVEEAMADAAPHSVAGQLSMLAALHEDDKLTDDEFEAAKAKVLGR